MSRVKNRLKLILSLAILALSIASHAKSEFAKPLTYWVDKYRKNPSNSLHVFNLGVAYHREGQFKKAIQYYVKTIRLKSKLAPAAFLYMAHSYEELGNPSKALRALNRVTEEKLPTRLQVRVENLRNRLLGVEKDESEVSDKEEVDVEEPRKFFTFWDLSFGGNSNPDYEATPTMSDTQYQAKLYMSYEIWANESWEFRPDFTFDGTMYSTTTESNTNYYTLTAPLSYYASDTRIQLTPDFTLDTLDGALYSKTTSATLDFNQKLNSYYVSLNYQYSNVSVDDADSSYLNGFGQVGGFEIRRQSDESDLSVLLNYSDYNYADSDDVIASYLGPGLTLTYSRYIEDWDYTAYVSGERREYDPDSSNSGFVRKDRRWTLSLSTGYTFSTWARLYGSVTFSRNNSNDDDNDYNQFVYLLGLSGSY